MKFFQRIKLLAATVASFFKQNFQHIDKVLTVVDIVKAAADNPALDLLAALSGQGWSADLLGKIRQALTVAMDTLSLTAACTKEPDEAAKIVCFLKALRKFTPAMRAAVYSKLATLVTMHLSDYTLTQAEADTFTQLAYADRKANTLAPSAAPSAAPAEATA
ncbi:MAG: hypothetical protein ACRYFZ_00900 [Janthinobacterium lividum]